MSTFNKHNAKKLMSGLFGSATEDEKRREEEEKKKKKAQGTYP